MNISNKKIVDSFLPQGVCVKVKYLRPTFTDLEAWCNEPSNILVTRRGRVFIGSGTEKHVFVYKDSPWRNPFTLKDHTLAESLAKFEEHLTKLLLDDNVRAEFLELANAKHIGCFCLPGDSCHRDIILKKLSEFKGLQVL